MNIYKFYSMLWTYKHNLLSKCVLVQYTKVYFTRMA